MEKMTKTYNGKRYIYRYGDKVFRTSKRDYRYVCIATSRESLKSWPVSLGNNIQSTRNSMAFHLAHYCDLQVIEIIQA